MGQAWRGFATFFVAAIILAGAWAPDAAHALSQQDAQDCGSQDTSLGTANKRIAACTRIIKEVKALKQLPPQVKTALATAYAARALAYSQLQDMKATLADCNESLRIDPNNAIGLLLRGTYYGDKREFDRSYADLDKGVRLNPQMAEFYAVRALVHFLKGNFDSVFSDASEAIRLKPELALSYVARAGAHYERGDRVRALADVNQAIRLQADFDTAFAARAWLYYKMGQPAKARDDAEKALSLSPTNRGALETRGCLLVDADDIESGLADLTQAVDMGSNTYDPFLCRAKAYELTSMAAEAMSDYRKVLELATTGRDAPQAKAAARERMAAIQSGQMLQRNPAPQATTAALPPQQSAQAVQAPQAVQGPQAVQAPQAGFAKAPAKPSDRRIALVIGMSAYTNVQPLPNPASDARAVADSFRRLGFAEVVEHYDLPRSQLEKELKHFGDRAANADWAVVYYAGHGVEVDGVNYLVPVDAALAKAEHVEDEAIPLPRLIAKAEQARKLRLVILDACRNNPFKMQAAGGRTRSIGRGLGRVEPAGGVLVAFAARDGTTADDGVNGHSPFTQAFLENVEKPGLEISLLFRRVRNSVLGATGNRQEPFTYGSLPDEGLYFVDAVR